MTADEMFEKLGYAKDEGYGEDHIRYTKNDIGYEEIEFETKEERVFCGEQTAIYGTLTSNKSKV